MNSRIRVHTSLSRKLKKLRFPDEDYQMKRFTKMLFIIKILLLQLPFPVEPYFRSINIIVWLKKKKIMPNH